MSASPRSSRRLTALFVPTAIALALAACGGSGDDSSGGTVASPLALSGTAATGAAIAGGNVEAVCAGGSGSNTTTAAGTYNITITGATLPCVLRVTKDGTVLHSLASGSGTSATVNLTPVSEIVVAQLAGGDPAAFFAGYDPAAAPAPADVQAAVTAVVATLKSAGIDLTGTDVLGGTLVAANGSTAGNAFDQALDALNTRLDEAGITLAALVATVASSSPAAPATALNATPSLPADMLLRAAAPNCSSFRSGKYRVVFFMPSGGSGVATDTLTLDAPNLTIVNGGQGDSDTLTPNGNCRYAQGGGATDLVITPAGVGLVRSQEDGVMRIGMLFPEQTHAVSALAGTWNYIGLGDMNGVGGTATLHGGELSVDATGRATAGVFCGDLKTCEAETPDARETFVANAQGGFDYDDGRAFAYRSGGGELMVVFISPDGATALATRKVARTLPVVGTVSRSLNFTVAQNYAAPFMVTESENTITSLAGDGLSFARNAVTNFTPRVTRPETVQINVPRDGFAHRVPQTVTASDGASQTVAEWVTLTLRGTGITPVAFPASQQLTFSVTKP